MSKRHSATAAPGLLEDYSQAVDDLFAKVSQRAGFRQDLTGLLLGRARTKTLTGLVQSEPVVGAQEARVQWFLSESTWDAVGVNERRLDLLLKSAELRPSESGALVIAETGDRKDGHTTARRPAVSGESGPNRQWGGVGEQPVG